MYVTRVTHEMQYGCVRNCLQVRFRDDLKSGPDDIPRPFSSPPAPPSSTGMLLPSSLLVLTIGIFATYLLAKSRTHRPHYSLRDPHFPGDMGSCGLGGREGGGDGLIDMMSPNLFRRPRKRQSMNGGTFRGLWDSSIAMLFL